MVKTCSKLAFTTFVYKRLYVENCLNIILKKIHIKYDFNFFISKFINCV